MAVGDIERGQSVDGARERGDRRLVVDHPELMAHAVVRGDVDRRLFRGGAREQGVDCRRRRIGQHDQAGLRIDRLDLAHAVVFLRRRRQLVLADAVFGVSRDRRDRREAGLDVTAPSQAVGVVAGLVVAHERAGGDHAAKILARLGVDRVVIGCRSPDRDRSRPWRRAESSTACLSRDRALPRSKARRRAGQERPPRVPAPASTRERALSGSMGLSFVRI